MAVGATPVTRAMATPQTKKIQNLEMQGGRSAREESAAVRRVRAASEAPRRVERDEGRDAAEPRRDELEHLWPTRSALQRSQSCKIWCCGALCTDALGALCTVSGSAEHEPAEVAIRMQLVNEGEVLCRARAGRGWR